MKRSILIAAFLIAASVLIFSGCEKIGGPNAAFSADTTEVVKNSTVNFIDESINYPTSWKWEFGDGKTSTKQHPTHTYSKPGSYTVELTVSNSYGSDTKKKSDYIKVGRVKWQFKTESQSGTSGNPSPAIGSDGTVYSGLGVDNNYFYAVNPDGTEKWRFETVGPVISSPAVNTNGTIYIRSYKDSIGADGTIYAGTYKKHSIYAIDSDGSKKWQFKADNDVITTALAVGDNETIYGGSDEGFLYAINPDGTQKWKCSTESSITTSPAIGIDGTIYTESRDNLLYAVSPDGSVKWQYTFGNSIPYNLAIGRDGTIMVSCEDYLAAINPDGTEKWRYDIQDYFVSSSPSIGKDGTIYVGSAVGSTKGKLYAINPDGSLKWQFETEGAVQSSPAIDSEGTVYVRAWDNYFYAINPDGSQKWCFETKDPITSSPVIGEDGTIYIGSYNKLYAIQGNSKLADSPWPMYQHDSEHTGRKD